MKCSERRGAGMTLTARGQVAHGYDDCEGDLLTRARALAGPACVISAEMARAACEGVYTCLSVSHSRLVFVWRFWMGGEGA